MVELFLNVRSETQDSQCLWNGRQEAPSGILIKIRDFFSDKNKCFHDDVVVNFF